MTLVMTLISWRSTILVFNRDRAFNLRSVLGLANLMGGIKQMEIVIRMSQLSLDEVRDVHELHL